MVPRRRRWTRITLLAILSTSLLVALVKSRRVPNQWFHRPPWRPGIMTKWRASNAEHNHAPHRPTYAEINYPAMTDADAQRAADTHVNPPNATLSLILAHTADTFPAWAYATLGDHHPSLAIHAYCTDCAPPHHRDPIQRRRPTISKGHEALPYLQHMITHYDDLSPINIFAHAHQFTWHNNDLLDSSTALAVTRLRAEYVVAQGGYANLRCHREPGCAGHLRPLDDAQNPRVSIDKDIPQAPHMAAVWRELFPGVAVPERLSAPCCGQFAVSREAVRRLPRSRYEGLARWLKETHLSDEVSGRVFEYVWQFLFLGMAESCPEREWECYCGMYGVCFEDGKEGYEEWFALREEWRGLENRLRELVRTEGEESLATEEASEMVRRARQLSEDVPRRREMAGAFGNVH